MMLKRRSVNRNALIINKLENLLTKKTGKREEFYLFLGFLNYNKKDVVVRYDSNFFIKTLYDSLASKLLKVSYNNKFFDNILLRDLYIFNRDLSLLKKQINRSKAHLNLDIKFAVLEQNKRHLRSLYPNWKLFQYLPFTKFQNIKGYGVDTRSMGEAYQTYWRIIIPNVLFVYDPYLLDPTLDYALQMLSNFYAEYEWKDSEDYPDEHFSYEVSDSEKLISYKWADNANIYVKSLRRFSRYWNVPTIQFYRFIRYFLHLEENVYKYFGDGYWEDIPARKEYRKKIPLQEFNFNMSEDDEEEFDYFEDERLFAESVDDTPFELDLPQYINEEFYKLTVLKELYKKIKTKDWIKKFEERGVSGIMSEYEKARIMSLQQENYIFLDEELRTWYGVSEVIWRINKQAKISRQKLLFKDLRDNIMYAPIAIYEKHYSRKQYQANPRKLLRKWKDWGYGPNEDTLDRYNNNSWLGENLERYGLNKINYTGFRVRKKLELTSFLINNKRLKVTKNDIKIPFVKNFPKIFWKEINTYNYVQQGEAVREDFKNNQLQINLLNMFRLDNSSNYNSLESILLMLMETKNLSIVIFYVFSLLGLISLTVVLLKLTVNSVLTLLKLVKKKK